MQLLIMSKFEAAKKIFEIESSGHISEEIPEDLGESSASLSSPEPKAPSKPPARPEEAKVPAQVPQSVPQEKLLLFKQLIKGPGRTTFLSQCEKRDPHQLQYVMFTDFLGVLKGMGFRLRLDEARQLVQALGVYLEKRELVYYLKLVSAVLRKLYLKEPYQPPAPLTKPNAANVIIAGIRRIKARQRAKQELLAKAKGPPPNPVTIVKALGAKLAAGGSDLLGTFQKIDKDASGFIEIAELALLFADYGIKLLPVEVRAVFELIDTAHKGKISYRDLRTIVDVHPPEEAKVQASVLDQLKVSDQEISNITRDYLSALQQAITDKGEPLTTVLSRLDFDRGRKLSFPQFSDLSLSFNIPNTQFDLRQVFNFLDKNQSGFLDFAELEAVLMPAVLKSSPREAAPTAPEQLLQTFKEQSREIPATLLEQRVEEIKASQEEKQIGAMLIPELGESGERGKEDSAVEKAGPSALVLALEQKAREKDEQEKKLLEKTIQDRYRSELEEIKEDQPATDLQLYEKPLLPAQLRPSHKPKTSSEKPATGRSSMFSLEKTGRTSKKSETTAKSKLTLEDKAIRAVAPPQKTAAAIAEERKRLEAVFKAEIVKPAIRQAVIFAESQAMNKSIQKEYQSRPAVKDVFLRFDEWEKPVVNVLPRTLWAVGQIGRVGLVDSKAALQQFDLSTGQSFQPIHVGRSVPLREVPLLAVCCDPKSLRLYLLDKQWLLEVWELHHPSPGPLLQLPVLAKPIGADYVQAHYPDRTNDLYPTILEVAASQMLLVNATSADGCVYFFNPVSMTIERKLRMDISELETPASVLTALQHFASVLQQCEALGVSQTQAFQLMDKNGDNELSKDELRAGLSDLKVQISEEDLQGLVTAMDIDGSGRVSLQEFRECLTLQMRLEEMKMRKEKANYAVPDWVNSLNANTAAREALFKLFQAFDRKGYDPVQLFSIFDTNNSGVIARVEFERTLMQLLSPLVTQTEIDLLTHLADRDNSGAINYREFTELLDRRNLTPVQSDALNSSLVPRDSITYVQQRCLELGVDLLKLFQAETGSMTKPRLSRLLLTLPLGLEPQDIVTICERDIHFDPEGCFDYEELFRTEAYSVLVEAAEIRFSHDKKSPRDPKYRHFTRLPESQKHAIIESIAYVEDLELLAFTCVQPESSLVFLKHTKGRLLGRLVGHVSKTPPVLVYVRSAGCLVTGEKRRGRGERGREKLCEILVWNLHGEMVEKFQVNPPWTVRPSLRIPAHEENILDLAYLPHTQLVASAGADHTIKLWNPTGTPYSLTEPHRLSLARQKPGYYTKAPKQTTQANLPMSLVDTIRLGDNTCYRLQVAVYQSCEWLLSLTFTPPKLTSEGKSLPGFLRVFGFDKVRLDVPVNKLDVPVPDYILEQCRQLGRRKRTLDSFRASLPDTIDLVLSQVKVHTSVYRELSEQLRLGVLLEDYQHLEKAFKTLGQLPLRKLFGTVKEVTPGEVYRLMTRMGVLVKTSFGAFITMLEECKRLHHTQALGISSTYSHPGFATLAHHIRGQELDLENWLHKQDPKHTGILDRKALQRSVLALNYGLTESETNAMMEELDPYFTCKIQITHLLDLFRSDLLAAKLLGLSKPTQLINQLRACVFPHHSRALQYAMFELADPQGYMSLSEFTRALNMAQVAVDGDIAKAVFELLAEDGRMAVAFFIRQVYSQKHGATVKEIEQVLLEIKLRLSYQRLPLQHFFSDENGPLVAISTEEFIGKCKLLGVEVADEALVRTAKFLSTTMGRSEGIQLAHYTKHLQRLPESMSFRPTASPPLDVVRRILEGKMKKDMAGLRETLLKSADQGGVLTAAQMRDALNAYFGLDIASPVVDAILAEVLGVESLHFSQIMAKIDNLTARPEVAKVENINLVLREAILAQAAVAHRPFEDLGKQLFQALKERDNLGKGWVPVADFVNVLRFNLPSLGKDVQGQIFLQAEKDQVNIEAFALEALRGVPGVLTASQAAEAQKKFEATVDEAFVMITTTVRNSGVSLERAFSLFDKDKDRVLSLAEFQQALQLLDIHLQRDHMEVLMEVFDKNHDGVISYTEFLQAINTHTAAKPTVSLDHWRVHFLRLNPAVCEKFLPRLDLFTVKVLRTNPPEHLIPYRVFLSVLEEIGGFEMQEIEALADFAVEGSREQLASGLLPSQRPAAQFAFSKLNELIHYSHFTEAFTHLMKPDSPALTQSVPSEAPSLPAKALPAALLSPGDRLEKELFEYLSKRMSEQHISLEKLYLLIDTDGNGVITKDELGIFMYALGYKLADQDLDALMKVIDENADETLSYKELRLKLLKYGYVEPEDSEVYTHQWADLALARWVQLFHLQKENGFPTYEALFLRYDYNKDRVLSGAELRQAAAEVVAGRVSKEEVEHVTQILLVHSKGELSFEALLHALGQVERDLPRLKRLENQLDAVMFAELVKQSSPFTLVRKTADQLSETALSLRRKQQLKQVSRGLSLLSHQVYLSMTEQLLRYSAVRLEELLRAVCVRCQGSIVAEAGLVLLNPQDAGQANVLDFPELKGAYAARMQSGDFRVMWEDTQVYNYALKICSGLLLSTQMPVSVEVYAPEGLKHISTDGNTSEKHLANMIKHHAYLQTKRPDLVRCIGTFERRVGVDATDKEVFVFLEQRPGRSLREAISANGGLLQIPVIQNTRSSLFLVKFWGRLILDLLYALQGHSVVLRTLRPDSLLLSPDGLSVSLLSLRGMGVFDESGKIVEAPDIAEFLPSRTEVLDDAYLAPEYLLARASDLTSAVDVWSFGVLLYDLLCGQPPPSFLEALKSWYGARPLPADFGSIRPAPQPCPSFAYAPFESVEVLKGKVVPATHRTLNMVKCIQVRSYSGLVRETDAIKEAKFDLEAALDSLMKAEEGGEALQAEYERLATLQHTSQESKNELGLLFDLIALCLQVEPSRRPTVKALLKCPFFQMDQYELLQAQRLAGSMSAFKSPELVVTQRITQPLRGIVARAWKPESLDVFMSLVDAVEQCICETAEAKAATQELNSLLTLQDAEPEATSSSLTPALKDSLLHAALNSSNAPLVKQIVADRVLDMLVYVALEWFKLGEDTAVTRLVQLISSVMFEYYTFASPASPYADCFLDALLKLFVGENLHLASRPDPETSPFPTVPYVLRPSYWTPKLFQLLGPLYKDTISENGLGQHYYPVVRDCIANDPRSADYFSELMSLAENLYLLRTSSTGTAARKNALKHVRSMLITRNQDKLRAALDLRLPQHLVHLLQDPDHQVRLETIQIYQELSRGCLEPEAVHTAKALETHKFFSVLNFFGVAKNVTKESTRDLAKLAFPKMETSPALSMLAQAFESPAYMVPLVRLLKWQSEPYGNKEALVGCLLNVLRGTDGMLRAFCSPATDGIATLCKSLVVHAKNTDNRSSRMLAPLIREALERALVQGRPLLLRAFENTPGAKALLRDQGLAIPKPVSLQQLLAVVPKGELTYDVAASDTVLGLIRDAKCWLQYIYRQNNVPHDAAYAGIGQVIHSLIAICENLWPVAAAVPSPGVFVAYVESQRDQARLVISGALALLQWMTTMELEYLWLEQPGVLVWLCESLARALQECLKADVFRVYPMTNEAVTIQDILTQLLTRPAAKKPLADLQFGRLLGEQLGWQYDFIRKVVFSGTEFLQVIPFYARQCDLRLKALEAVLGAEHYQLQAQFLETRFVERLAMERLTDHKALEARYSKLNHAFLPFRECAPIRGEAIAMVQTILTHRTSSPEVYDDLILHLRRANTVQAELGNLKLYQHGSVVHATALQLLSVLVESGDSQLEFLLLQEETHREVSRALELHPILANRYGVLKRYCEQFK